MVAPFSKTMISALALAGAAFLTVEVSVASVQTGRSRAEYALQGVSVLVVDSPLFVSNPVDGVLTIAEAVEQANSDGTATIITFDPTVFPPTVPTAIKTDKRLYMSEANDEVDGVRAGVIFRPAGAASDDGYAFQLEANNVAIRNLAFDEYRYGGIRATSGATGAIEDVTITNSYDSGLGRGIFIRSGASMLVRRAHIADVPHDGIGINASSAVVEDCIIERAGDDGLSAWNSDLTARGNQLLDCLDDGIAFSGDTDRPPGTLTLSSVENYWDGTNHVVGDNVIRPTGSGEIWVHPASTVISEIPVDPGDNLPPPLDDSQAVEFYLPFDAGQATYISQGIGGWSTHSNSVAFDMSLWDGIGTPIRACAPGRVIRVYNGQDGPGASRQANMVEVDHGYGIIGRYVHPVLDTITVTPGELVGRYDHLADGGTSGHSTGPHLHMEFQKRYRGSVWPWEVCFQDIEPVPCAVPQSGQTYTSANSALAPPGGFADSVMPADVFVDVGDPDLEGDEYVITLTDSVPMAYFRTQQRYMFRGTVPANVKVVKLWVRDYVTLDHITSVEGLVHNGRFAVGFELPDSMAGPYRMGLDGTVDDETWSFWFRRTLRVIVAGPSGLVETPPDDGPPVWDPAGDEDEDGIPNDIDPWMDITVTSPRWEDGTSATVTLRDAVKAANNDWRPTYVRFDPAVFPPGSPVTILCERRYDIGNDGDVFDATGAGVILRYVGPPEETHSAFQFRGTGTTIRNMTMIDFPGQFLKVATLSRGIAEDVHITSGGAQVIHGNRNSELEVRRSTLIGPTGTEQSTCWIAADSSILMENVSIRQGRAGFYLNDRSTAIVTNLDIADTDKYPVQLMTGSTASFRNLNITGRPGYSSVWTEPGVGLELLDSVITGGSRGVYLQDGGAATIRNTDILNLTTSDGIAVYGVSELTLENSVIENTPRHGVALFDNGTLFTCDDTVTRDSETAWLGTNRISQWGQSQSAKAIYMPSAQLVGGVCPSDR